MNQDKCVHRFDSFSICTDNKGSTSIQTCSFCGFKDERFSSKDELRLFRLRQDRIALQKRLGTYQELITVSEDCE